MKRWTIPLLAVTILLAGPASAHANVITPAGPGQPIVAQSNTGSGAGQTHRSATGSLAKGTHDQAVYIWDF